MRIVNIEDFFHPDAGYQVNIISKFLSDFGHEVYIITAQYDKTPEFLRRFFGEENIPQRDEVYEKRTGVRIIRLPIHKWVSGRAIYKKKDMLSAISGLAPDVVFSHGASTFCTMRLIVNHDKIPFLVTDNHMDLQASNNPFARLFRIYYRFRIAPIVNRNRIPVFCLGSEDRYVIDVLGVDESCTLQSTLGSDTRFFMPDAGVRAAMREQYDISDDDLVFVYAGKLDDSKGGMFLAQCIEERFELEKNIVFVIVGDTCGDNAERIEALFRASQNRVIREPTQLYTSLPQYFQMADAFLLPRQCSLTLFDAQACGLPVLAEDYGVNQARLAYGNGLLFKSGDMGDFRRIMSDFAQTPPSQREAMGEKGRRRVCDILSYEDITRNMLADIESAKKAAMK